LIALGTPAFGLAIFLIEGNSDEHATAESAALRHPAILADVGAPVRASWPCWATGITQGAKRHGIHRFAVSGPKGEGKAAVDVRVLGMAGMRTRRYELLSLDWTFDGKTRRLPVDAHEAGTR
jgi:hypothetical protein